MNIQERLDLNKQKIVGIQTRLNDIEIEKNQLLQEALRLDGENRVLMEQSKEAPEEK